MGGPSPWYAQREAGYDGLLERLTRDGFSARVTCTACPVQLEGNLPSGEAFYARCRHTQCSLDVGPPTASIDEVIDHPIWSIVIEPWPTESEKAGWLEAEEFEAVLRSLVKAYYERQGPAGEG